MSRPDPARTVLDLAGRAPALDGTGATRLVCVEGPAGSGKSTLAARVRALGVERGLSCHVVATDDVLRGWDGLARLGPTLLRDVVQPLREGRPAAYRRYDWHAARLAETCPVPAADLVVLEGVGSGHLGYADAIGVLVWVEAPRTLRRARGLARDGEALMPFWDAFVVDEDRLHAAERTRERADVLVDGVSGEVRLPRRPARRTGAAAARPPRGPRPAP